MKISMMTTPNVYMNQPKASKHQTSFKANPDTGLLNRAEAKLAKSFVKVLDTKVVEKLVLNTAKHPGIQKNLTSHLIVTGSTMLSGFYMAKTLKNKQMDEDKRKTLAVNQGLVWLVSTVMAYSFDGWARGAFNKNILAPFEKANMHLDPAKRNALKAGMEIARPIMIVDLVYRFIAPVIVTPWANAIGNRLQEAHKKSKQA